MHRLVIMAVTVLALAGPASAQIYSPPGVVVFFDQALLQPFGTGCQGIGQIDTIYVAAVNANESMKSVEFMIEYPASMAWVADMIGPGALATGDSPSGITVTWTTPLAASQRMMFFPIVIVWMCDDCSTTYMDQVRTRAHPGTGFSRAVTWPTLGYLRLLTYDTFICETVPVEDKTWGAIKALYRD